MDAKQLLQLQNQIKRDRYLHDRAERAAQSKRWRFVGYDSTRNVGVVTDGSVTRDGRILTNGMLVPGQTVNFNQAGSFGTIEGTPYVKPEPKPKPKFVPQSSEIYDVQILYGIRRDLTQVDYYVGGFRKFPILVGSSTEYPPFFRAERLENDGRASFTVGFRRVDAEVYPVSHIYKQWINGSRQLDSEFALTRFGDQAPSFLDPKEATRLAITSANNLQDRVGQGSLNGLYFKAISYNSIAFGTAWNSLLYTVEESWSIAGTGGVQNGPFNLYGWLNNQTTDEIYTATSGPLSFLITGQPEILPGVTRPFSSYRFEPTDGISSGVRDYNGSVRLIHNQDLTGAIVLNIDYYSDGSTASLSNTISYINSAGDEIVYPGLTIDDLDVFPIGERESPMQGGAAAINGTSNYWHMAGDTLYIFNPANGTVSTLSPGASSLSDPITVDFYQPPAQAIVYAAIYRPPN